MPLILKTSRSETQVLCKSNTILSFTVVRSTLYLRILIFRYRHLLAVPDWLEELMLLALPGVFHLSGH